MAIAQHSAQHLISSLDYRLELTSVFWYLGPKFVLLVSLS